MTNMVKIALTPAAGVLSAQAGLDSRAPNASPEASSSAFKDLLGCGMQNQESAALSPETGTATTDLDGIETAIAKNLASVNLQAAADALDTEYPDGSEAAAMAGSLALVTNLQENPGQSLSGTRETITSQTSSSLSQPQPTLDPLATIQHDRMRLTPDAVPPTNDNNGKAIMPVVGDQVSGLPGDGKGILDPASLGLTMTGPEEARQFSATMLNVRVSGQQAANMNARTNFSTALTDTTPGRIIKGSQPTPVVGTVNLSDISDLGMHLQVQESPELTDTVVQPRVELSLEAEGEGIERTLAERLNPISNTPARTTPTVNSGVSPNTPLDVQEGNWDKPLGQQLLWMAQNQMQRAELRVDPPHLGPIEVHLSLNDDQASVRFFSHDAGVRETIENTLPKLRDLFDSQGMQLNNANVSDQSLARQQSQSGNQLSGQGNGSPDDETVPDSVESELAHSEQVAEEGSGIVDHYV